MSSEEKASPLASKSKRATLLPALRGVVVLLDVPLAVQFHQAHRSGLSSSQVFSRLFRLAQRSVAGKRRRFKFEHRPRGRFNGASGPLAADLDGDGDLDAAAVTCYNLWERPETQSVA